MTSAFLLLLLASSPAADTGPTLHLANAGRTDYVIVVRREAPHPERHAAQELARFLKEISGATFPIKEMESGVQNMERTIRIGGAAHAVISPEEIARLGAEGYVIRSQGPTLAIAGGQPRGTLYGVYSFLEDSLDCRWFTSRVSRIPKRTAIEIPPLNRSYVPPLEYRALDFPDSRDGDWAARNKVNGSQAHLEARHGGKITYGPFVHTFDSILNPQTHFHQHPEYFSEVNGKRLQHRTQLCLSNPEVLRIATETVRRWMREQPQATIFSVSQNDWYNYCTCPKCAQITKEEGSPAGPYLRFVNAIADAVRTEFPDRVVDTLAYQFTRRPPEHVRPHANVIVRLCSIECCFSHPLTSAAERDKANAAFAADLRRWQEICSRLYVWDYVINFAHTLMPFPNLFVLQPNIKFLVEHGVKGIYEEGDYFTRGGEFAELRTWILAKTLWDPNYDTDRAISEFLAGYYEDAAPALRKYITLFHDRARRENIHFRIFDGPSSPLFSPEVLAQATSLLDEAEACVRDKPALRHRVDVARLPVLYVQIAKLALVVRDPKTRTRENVGQLKSQLARFDAIARKEGVTHVGESRSYEDWLRNLKRQVEAP